MNKFFRLFPMTSSTKRSAKSSEIAVHLADIDGFALNLLRIFMGDLPCTDKKAPRWLDRKSLGALVRAVQRYGTPRDRALIALLIHSGVRVSEACGLKVADVVVNERSGSVVVRRGKGEKRREVPLNVTIRKVLSDYLEGHPGGEWMFVSRRGKRLSTRAAERVVAKYAGIAGIGATPHQLRHNFCKGLLDAGVSLDKVALLAGHSNLNTTARYVRPSVQDLERAVDKLSWE